MEKTHLFRQDFELVQALLTKLERGELAIDELEQLTSACSNLYERAVILKYKAFEQKTKGQELESEPDSVPEPDSYTEQDENREEVFVELEEVVIPAEEDMPAFDFDILGDDEPEHEPSIIEELVSAEAPKEEPVKEEPAAPGNLFTDNSLVSRLAAGKITTLVGAFGLNERLRFINNLFDGSSEAFSAAVKELDAQSGGDAAMQRVQLYATQYNWDHEDESVAEFVTYIQRRYA